MRFFNTTPEIQQRIAVLVPLVALGLSIFVVYPKWQNYQEMLPKLEKQRQDLAGLKAAAAPTSSRIIAAIPALPTEPPEFMGQITAIAREANCRVNGFDLKPSTGAADAGPVQPLHAQIMLIANYASIRNFIARLAGAPRMLVITELDLAPATRTTNDGLAPDALEATVDIERYVLAGDRK